MCRALSGGQVLPDGNCKDRSLRITIIACLSLISLAAVVGKSYFLAPTRLGWFMMLANVPYETFCRGWRKRWHADALAMLGLGAGWTAVLGPWAGLAWVTVYGSAWAYTLILDLKWRNGTLTVQDARYAGEIPLPLPKLILHVKGPVLKRGKTHDLGAWPVGRREAFEFIILNPADKVHCQFPLRFELKTSSEAIHIENDPSGEHPGPDPGEVLRLPLALRAAGASGEVRLAYRLTLGSYTQSGTLRIGEIFEPTGVHVSGVKIDRWKGGARGAWCWRGDVDLYDPATWQSIEGLRPSFELARRFRVPHTLLLSARLTLDEQESAAHSKAIGLDRRSRDIPRFAEWLRQEIYLANEMDWPVEAPKRYFCELGNHYWLHYGTHSSADPGNHWQTWVGPGVGRYPWTDANGDSLKEQTDNSLQCVRTFQKVLNYTPTVWGIPGRANNRYTPQAIEASGMLVAGDSDCQAFVNVFCQPPPHHPKGTTHLVELSKKYPGDPLFGNQLAMLKYWTYHARRHGRVMLFMAHHHLRGYESGACFRLTEEMLREVLAEGDGDFYLGTMTAVGLYWERVLCPKHKWVAATTGAGLDFTVANRGDKALDAIPVEVRFSNGKRTLALVDIPAGGSTTVNWTREKA